MYAGAIRILTEKAYATCFRFSFHAVRIKARISVVNAALITWTLLNFLVRFSHFNLQSVAWLAILPVLAETTLELHVFSKLQSGAWFGSSSCDSRSQLLGVEWQMTAVLDGQKWRLETGLADDKMCPSLQPTGQKLLPSSQASQNMHVAGKAGSEADAHCRVQLPSGQDSTCELESTLPTARTDVLHDRQSMACTVQEVD